MFLHWNYWGFWFCHYLFVCACQVQFIDISCWFDAVKYGTKYFQSKVLGFFFFNLQNEEANIDLLLKGEGDGE